MCLVARHGPVAVIWLTSNSRTYIIYGSAKNSELLKFEFRPCIQRKLYSNAPVRLSRYIPMVLA